MSGIEGFIERLSVKCREGLSTYLGGLINVYFFKKSVAVIVTVCFITNILGPAAFASSSDLPGEKEKKEADRIEYVLSNPDIPFTPSAIAQLKVKVEPNGVIMALEQNKKSWRPLGYWNGQNAYTPKADGKFVSEGNEGLRQACAQFFLNHNVPVDVTVIKKHAKSQQEAAKEKLQKELISATMPAPPESIANAAAEQATPMARLLNISTVNGLLNLLKELTDSASKLTSIQKNSILATLANQFGITLKTTAEQLKTIYAFLAQFFANGGTVINCAVESLSTLLGITDTVQKTAIGITMLLADILSGTFNLAKSTTQNQIFTSAAAVQKVAALNGLTLNAFQTNLTGLTQAIKSTTNGVILYLQNHFVTATKVVGDTIYYLDNSVLKKMTSAQWLNQMGE